jgi:TRAP-type C4-dicarboxylate transport system permease small subunit
LQKFEKFVINISKWFQVIAGVGITYVLVLSVADIIMNKVFKDPINWAFDSLSLVAVIGTVFAIPRVQLQHGHIEVEILENRFSRYWRKVNGFFIGILGAGVWGIIAWRSVLYGMDILRSGEVSMTVGWPIYPFIWFQAVCAAAVVLVLLAQAVASFKGRTR